MEQGRALWCRMSAGQRVLARTFIFMSMVNRGPPDKAPATKAMASKIGMQDQADAVLPDMRSCLATISMIESAGDMVDPVRSAK